MLYGASYYPQHREETDWQSDLETMRQAHVNALRVGDFAWRRMESSDGHYKFDWLDRFLNLAHAHNVGILLIPPLRCPPAWLFAQDRSLAIINERLEPLEFGSRYTFCINHPLLRRKGLALAQKMATRYAKHPAVIGWHLDNEYGDEPDCHCPVCREKWRSWLRQRYTNIEKLNTAWGTVFWNIEFDDFDQIPTPLITKTYHSPGLLQAWRHFRSDCTVEVIKLHAEAVRAVDTSHPITTNLQCLHNPRTNYHSLKAHLDIVGMNYYPAYGPNLHANALGLAVNRGILNKNIQIHELRNAPHAVPGRQGNAPQPGEIERLALHTIAHGADAIYFFQWTAVRFGPEQSHGTPTGYDGRPNRYYPEIQRIGEKLRKLAPRLAGTSVKSEIAVFYDFPTRWSMQTSEEWVGPGHLHNDHVKKVYNAIRGLGVNCDAIGRDESFTNYKVLVAAFLNCIDEDVINKLAEFVAEGGILIFHPLCGYKNQDTEIYPTRLHPKLEKVFGIDARDFTTSSPGENTRFSGQYGQGTGEYFHDLVKLTSASAVSNFTEGWFSGYPAITRNNYGNGQAIYITTLADAASYRSFFARLLTDADVRLPLSSIAPETIEVAERSTPQGRMLLFLINNTSESQSLELSASMRDVWNGENLGPLIEFAPWQVRVCESNPMGN